MKCRSLAACAVAVVVCGLFAGSVEAQRLRSPLLSETEAQSRGLTRSWYMHLPVDSSRDQVEHAALQDGSLFVVTRRGAITAVDPETGQRLWTTSVGSPVHPTTNVAANRNYVAVLNGSTLYVLHRDTGKVFWSRKVRGAPGAGPALTADYVFVPTIGGALEGYSLKNHSRPPWYYTSSGRAAVQPVVSADSIAWPTDRGLFYVSGLDPLGIRFRVEATEAIVAAPAYKAPHFYFAGLDGYLYKVHERTGAMVWRKTTGNPISQAPSAIGDQVYAVTEADQLFCVGAEAGEERWWTPHIERVLAVSNERLYAIDSMGRLAVVRTDNGAVVSTLPVSNLNLFVHNQATDRIYLGTKTGLLQCLHEIAQVEPLKHIVPAGETPPPVRVEQQGLDEALGDADDDGLGAPMADEPDDADDPFGGAAPMDDNDPFGGGAPAAGDNDPFGGGDDPFGAGDGGNDDPFGGGGDDPFGN